MWMNVPSLQEALMNAELVEFRCRQGRRYELSAVLLLSCVAMMRGAKTEQEIALWIERDGQRWLKWLGVASERGPSAATVTRVFQGVESARLQAALILWAQQVMEILRPARLHEWEQTVVLRIETRAWFSGVSGHNAITALSQCLNSIIDTLIVAFDEREDAARCESLLAGLALTGYVESHDLLDYNDESALPVYSDRLAAPATGQAGRQRPSPNFNQSITQ